MGGMRGGAGADRLEAGPGASALFGEGGADVLVGSPEHDGIYGGDGDDELLAGGGNDYLSGDGGADVLSGGPGLDEVTYGATEPLRLSIGDGPNDGAAGEGDDIRNDVEGLTGGRGDDVLIGNAEANRLIAYGGHDVLRGEGGPDLLIGWGDGDELDPGAGPDRVEAGWFDRPMLVDGEADRLDCRARAPAIEADAVDVLKTCAPRVTVRLARRARSGGALRLRARCPGDSSVPCEGRLRVELRGGRRVSRSIRFGPIEPGQTGSVRAPLRTPVRRGTCMFVTAVTHRDDGLDTSTVASSPLRCLG
jgi:hypothetical protein